MILSGPLALVALAAAGSLALLSPPAGPNASASTVGGPFSLVDGQGRPVTDQDFRGRFMLVYFGYTSCPDVCPTTLADVASAVGKLGSRAGEVQPLFITADPKRDTAAVVGQYAASFPHVVGLTGTPEQVARVAGAYHVPYATRRTGPGPDGRMVASIPADSSADTIAADVARHLS